MLLRGNHLTIARDGREILTIDELAIAAHDRIGLIGPNGCGKSTLLDCLSGALPPVDGELWIGTSMARITQDGQCQHDIAPHWAKRLGVSAQGGSGGERMRRAIAAALSAGAPLLLADEPTSHLDIAGVLLTEKLLSTYDGALVLVSHDRRLLDKICTRIWAIENGRLRHYSGNYSAYLAQAALERAQAQAAHEAYQAEKARLTEAARLAKVRAKKLTDTSHFKSSEARAARGATAFYGAKQRSAERAVKAIKRRIDHLEVKEKPPALPQITMTLGSLSPITARKALSVQDLTVQYGERTILSHVHFHLPTGSRTVIMGPNGSGKSLLLQTLLGDNPAIQRANNLRIGYFAQGHANLAPNATALANACAQSQLPEHIVRTILARLQLREADIFRPVAELSGGEQAKVVFAKLLAGDYNLLILDEPTNYLDLFAAESLEQLLLGWNGTQLIVTHDRQFADKIATRLLLVQDGAVTTFNGSYSDYQDAKRRPTPANDTLSETRLAMRMAEITGKMAELRQKNQPIPQELEDDWQALLRAQQALRQKKK